MKLKEGCEAERRSKKCGSASTSTVRPIFNHSVLTDFNTTQHKQGITILSVSDVCEIDWPSCACC